MDIIYLPDITLLCYQEKPRRKENEKKFLDLKHLQRSPSLFSGIQRKNVSFFKKLLRLLIPNLIKPAEIGGLH